MRRLHVDLLSQTKADFAAGQDGQELLTPPPTPPSFPTFCIKRGRRTRARPRRGSVKCARRLRTRSFESGYFCRTCSIAKKGRVALCNKARRLDHGSDLTCSQIWHQTWKNGTAIPPEYQDKIRFINKRRVDDGYCEEEFW
eukprot:jgi/Phyca11/102521/e_gw1.7.1042.1